MKKKKVKIAVITVCLGMSVILGACAGKTASNENTEQVSKNNATEDTGRVEPEKSIPYEVDEEGQIKEQTFDVELKPWGKITFVSYAPNTVGNATTDVSFSILRDGEKIYSLPAMREANLLAACEYFDSVAAVSFPDYNGDGYSDVIAILNYSYVQGPDAGTGFTEVRVYEGQRQEQFTLNREASDTLTAMEGEKTISGVLEFLKEQGAENGADKNNKIAQEPWRQAYIDYLKNDCDTGANDGYNLIYIDNDDIPELVEYGVDCATGSRITGYSDGKVYVNQLRRLGFSYIEKQNLLCNSEGNMDCYYDLVCRMKHGQLEIVAEGDYGAKDNSNVQFDENNEPVYEYYWEKKEVSKETYQEKLNEVYDTSKAVPGYDWDNRYKLEEILAYLAGNEEADKPVYEGNWQIVSHEEPGISALSQEDIQDYMLMEFHYDKDRFQAGDTVFRNPVYRERKLSAEEFAAEYGGQVTFENLHISSDTVTEVTVENAEGIGSCFYVMSKRSMYIPWDGVFFRAEEY